METPLEIAAKELEATSQMTDAEIDAANDEWRIALKAVIARRDMKTLMYKNRPANYLTEDWQNNCATHKLDWAILWITSKCAHTFGYQFPLARVAGKSDIQNIEKRICGVCRIEKWVSWMTKHKKFDFQNNPELDRDEISEKIATICSNMIGRLFLKQMC